MSDDKPMVFLGTPDDKALIARLRAWYTPGETITGDVALYLEAADAVERLREEVSRLTAALSVTWSIAEG